MNAIRRTIAAASLGLTVLATSAAADDMASVQTFYDLLSNPGSETHVAAFLSATSETWESVGDYSGENEGRDGFVGQMGFFSQLIPDLDWSVQAMHQDGDFVTGCKLDSTCTTLPKGSSSFPCLGKSTASTS